MVALFSKISVNLRWAFFVRISYKYNVVGNIDIDRHLSTSSITSIRLHSHLIASSLDKVLPCVLLTNAININAPDLYSSECDLAWAAFLSSSVYCHYLAKSGISLSALGSFSIQRVQNHGHGYGCGFIICNHHHHFQ